MSKMPLSRRVFLAGSGLSSLSLLRPRALSALQARSAKTISFAHGVASASAEAPIFSFSMAHTVAELDERGVQVGDSVSLHAEAKGECYFIHVGLSKLAAWCFHIGTRIAN